MVRNLLPLLFFVGAVILGRLSASSMRVSAGLPAGVGLALVLGFVIVAGVVVLRLIRR